MAVYGVLGRVLGHSYTPLIYDQLAGLDYRRFEREPDTLEAFLHSPEWEGVNVTIPYKQAVLPYLTELSERAQRLGNVNTITRLPGGGLRGDNTDYFGFEVLLSSVIKEVSGTSALVLGTGGAAQTCACVLRDKGAQVRFVSRSGDLNYQNVAQEARDAHVIVNATPVGMYPHCPETPLDLQGFHQLKAVVDIVYNPAKTSLVRQAQALHIPAQTGLLMLVAQAAQACELYCGKPIDFNEIASLTRRLSLSVQNAVIVAKDAKTALRYALDLGRLLNKPVVDASEVLVWAHTESQGKFLETHATKSSHPLRLENLSGAERALNKLAMKSGQVVAVSQELLQQGRIFDILDQNAFMLEITAAGELRSSSLEELRVKKALPVPWKVWTQALKEIQIEKGAL